MKKNISEEIVATIKKEKIKPIEKWKLSFKNYSYWGIVTLMVLLSGAFFSLIILNLVDFGPEMFEFLKFKKFFRILIFSAPYLWIVSFAVCVVLGILIFQKTKTGYRHNILFITSVVLLIVSVLGVSAHFARMNERFEEGFLERGPNPKMMMSQREGKLFMPEEGILVGEVIEITNNEILLKDPMDENWTVEYSKKTKIGKGVNLVVGEKMMIFGKKKESRYFSAMGIRRLERRRDGGPGGRAGGRIGPGHGMEKPMNPRDRSK